MIFLVKSEFFGKVRKFQKITLPKNSYFAEIFILYDFILYQKIRTLPKNSYFTEIFVLDGKFRTPDVQVHSLVHLTNISILTTCLPTLPKNGLSE